MCTRHFLPYAFPELLANRPTATRPRCFATSSQVDVLASLKCNVSFMPVECAEWSVTNITNSSLVGLQSTTGSGTLSYDNTQYASGPLYVPSPRSLTFPSLFTIVSFHSHVPARMHAGRTRGGCFRAGTCPTQRASGNLMRTLPTAHLCPLAQTRPQSSMTTKSET